MKFMQTIKRHIQDNSGDGYIWTLFISVALLFIFGALFFIMSNAINMRSIRTSVDDAARDVFNDIEQKAYDNLTNGSTNDSFLSLDETQIFTKLAEHLGATIESSSILKYKNNEAINYKIENFGCDYIAGIIYKNDGTKSIIGDINDDDKVDEMDSFLAEAYINGEEPVGVTLRQVDINEDGIATVRDLLLLKGLIKYFKAHPIDSLESVNDKSSALLMITFQLTVPLQYGTFDFGASVDDYSYCSTLSFKAAQ